jgi:lysophospholipase L1-like esterase
VAGVAIAATRRSQGSPARRVALIGDSYAEGLGWELAKIFPDFKWEGHVGTNTSQWANHTGCGTCGDWLTEYKPDVVLVSLGVNDGVTPKASNYLTIVRGLQAIGARVMWIEPPAAVSTQSRYTIATLGVPVVPGTRAPLAADGLHPTPASYATWAQEIAGEVARS